MTDAPPAKQITQVAKKTHRRMAESIIVLVCWFGQMEQSRHPRSTGSMDSLADIVGRERPMGAAAVFVFRPAAVPLSRHPLERRHDRRGSIAG
jgi:hypothetical protein